MITVFSTMQYGTFIEIYPYKSTMQRCRENCCHVFPSCLSYTLDKISIVKTFRSALHYLN